jgi:glycosyltransferase involved in cell wall biosynthesis
MGQSTSDIDVLVVEAGEPRPLNDAGSRAIVDFLEGCRFVGVIAELGLESRPNELNRLISRRPKIVVLSRPGTFLRHHQSFDTETRIIYFAHDIHHQRMRAGLTFRSPHSETAVSAMEVAERECFQRADLSLFPTEEEAQQVQNMLPGARAEFFPYYWFDAKPRPESANESEQIVFVGSHNHAPNSDAVRWFEKEIWPQVSQARPGVICGLVGSWQDVIDTKEPKGIEALGNLSDDYLDRLLSQASVGIVPLRFGAGMKRKTLHYLARGLPTVSTSVGIQGLPELASGNHGAIIADTAYDFALAVSTLLGDSQRRSKMAAEATSFVQTRFSHAHYVEKVRRVLELA